MTIEHPMFPPRTGAAIISFPRVKPRAIEPSGDARYGRSRSRSAVKSDIDRHVKARKVYASAMAWYGLMQAEEKQAYEIEEARCAASQAYNEMMDAARALLICMPTDPKGLVDLLMYLEKHFSILPAELDGKSLAFELLRTVRLSVRAIARYGKYDGCGDDN